jgi:hypothetical protein
MKKIILALTLVFTFSVAQAGILIEPYMGYGITALESDNGGGGLPVEWGVKGQSLGVRAGVSYLGFFGALDYEMGSRDFTVDAGSASVTVSEKDLTNVGLAIGYDVPIIPIRVFGKYIMSATWEEGSSEWKGNGLGVGVGLTILPIVDINIEYKKLTFDEGLGAATEVTGQEIFLSISAPFVF